MKINPKNILSLKMKENCIVVDIWNDETSKADFIGLGYVDVFQIEKEKFAEFINANI